MLSEKQISQFTELLKNYKHEDLCVTSWNIEGINGNYDYKDKLLEDINVVVDNKSICISGNLWDEDNGSNKENKNFKIEFDFDKIQDVYVDKLNIFTDYDPEVHIMFGYMDRKYDLLNLT